MHALPSLQTTWGNGSQLQNSIKYRVSKNVLTSFNMKISKPLSKQWSLVKYHTKASWHFVWYNAFHCKSCGSWVRKKGRNLCDTCSTKAYFKENLTFVLTIISETQNKNAKDKHHKKEWILQFNLDVLYISSTCICPHWIVLEVERSFVCSTRPPFHSTHMVEGLKTTWAARVHVVGGILLMGVWTDFYEL